MRHFESLSTEETEALFSVPSQPFEPDAERDVVAYALGATLYSPATRPKLATDLIRGRGRGVMSTVICLEDSIADADVEWARDNLVAQIHQVSDRRSELPLVFVRVRAADQITSIVRDLGDDASILSGFVVPKFDHDRVEFLEAVAQASEAADHHFWTMPVIETPAVIHRETRDAALDQIAAVLTQWREQILAVRIGGTDLASAYAMRRPKELTVYDVRVIADVLSDVINRLGRPGEDGFIVTGPVWEYYSDSERLFKPQLRETPFREHQLDLALRTQLLGAELDGLIREVVLDRANGFLGKTVIHPTHVSVVHALSVVSHEDYSDAQALLGVGSNGGGAFRSEYRNKMNESNPHRAWAIKTVRRAAAFGVAAPGITFADLWAGIEHD